MSKEKIIRVLKKIKLIDVLGVFLFIILIIPAYIYKIILKIRKKRLWLICEEENFARDNGYIFFKYIKEEHPEIRCYYAINKKSSDYEKVAEFGKSIVNWKSIKHYFLFMSATENISSHKSGDPNHILFETLLLYFNLYNNRTFLQHGVLYQNFEMFHKPKCKFKIFITGAKPEYNFVNEKFMYDKNEVRYTGLARFDELYKGIVDNNMIFYMPTWRRYLNSENIDESLYLKRIISVLSNEKLHKVLEENDKYLYFCPHSSLRKYNDLFTSNSDRIKILDASKIDIQYYIRTAGMLITDFSSIHTDFAYMNKPILYYQYDYKDYMEKHIGKYCYDTYFDFKRDGFGEVVDNEDEFVIKLKNITNNNMVNNKKYKERIEKFFVLRDNKNCERIYEEIMRG